MYVMHARGKGTSHLTSVRSYSVFCQNWSQWLQDVTAVGIITWTFKSVVNHLDRFRNRSKLDAFLLVVRTEQIIKWMVKCFIGLSSVHVQWEIKKNDDEEGARNLSAVWSFLLLLHCLTDSVLNSSVFKKPENPARNHKYVISHVSITDLQCNYRPHRISTIILKSQYNGYWKVSHGSNPKYHCRGN